MSFPENLTHTITLYNQAFGLILEARTGEEDKAKQCLNQALRTTSATTLANFLTFALKVADWPEGSDAIHQNMGTIRTLAEYEETRTTHETLSRQKEKLAAELDALTNPPSLCGPLRKLNRILAAPKATGTNEDGDAPSLFSEMQGNEYLARAASNIPAYNRILFSPIGALFNLRNPDYQQARKLVQSWTAQSRADFFATLDKQLDLSHRHDMLMEKNHPAIAATNRKIRALDSDIARRSEAEASVRSLAQNQTFAQEALTLVTQAPDLDKALHETGQQDLYLFVKHAYSMAMLNDLKAQVLIEIRFLQELACANIEDSLSSEWAKTHNHIDWTERAEKWTALCNRLTPYVRAESAARTPSLESKFNTISDLSPLAQTLVDLDLQNSLYVATRARSQREDSRSNPPSYAPVSPFDLDEKRSNAWGWRRSPKFI